MLHVDTVKFLADGGLSGATPSEAVSWGKIDPDRLPDAVVCYVDSTVALPLLTSYALAKHKPAHPGLVSLHRRIAERPRIAAYLASARRLAFNEKGIFRHYPELEA